MSTDREAQLKTGFTEGRGIRATQPAEPAAAP